MQSVNPGAGDIEEVEQDFYAVRLSGKDYIWEGGAVHQELTKGWRGWLAMINDELSNMRH